MDDGQSILKVGTGASRISLVAVALEQPQLNPTRRELMKSLRKTRVTLDAIATKIGIGHNAVQEMSGNLDYRKKGHPAAR